MSTFKNIKAYIKTITGCLIVIERYKSGATPYGDGSAHSFKIYDPVGKQLTTRYFDTRYEGISTDKDKWLKFWLDFILENYDFKEFKVETYTEEDIELL